MTTQKPTAPRYPRATNHATPSLPDDRQWHPLAVSWWAAAWSSQMAGKWLPSDIYGLWMLVALVDSFWKANDGADRLALALEIRLQSASFGLDPLSRLLLSGKVKGRRASEILEAL